METTFICVTCGTQYPPSNQAPNRCPICEDERQYIGLNGQEWTTLERIQSGHKNIFFEEGSGLWGIITEPKFGIGQRALLVQASSGNILWDCVSLIDAETIERVYSLGGISAIAISHPHYYSSMIEWSKAFGDIPIYIHEDDREWVQRPHRSIHFWEGERYSIASDLTLVRVGGHFTGYQVLHWTDGNALLCGDMPQVCPDRRYVSFMYSYPNLIPVDAKTVRRIVSTLIEYPFDKIYGAWRGFVVRENAHERLKISAERYLRAIGATEDR